MGSGRGRARPTLQGGLGGGVRRARAPASTPPLRARLPPPARPRGRRGRRPGTFLSAFRQIERFEPRPSLAAWLNTIALRTASRAASASAPARTARSMLSIAGAAAPRLGRRRPGLADPDPTADPQAAVEAADLRRAVGAAIAALPFKYRAAVVLRHVMGLDDAEAARALDIRSTRSRATSCGGRNSSARRSRPSSRRRRRGARRRPDRDGAGRHRPTAPPGWPAPRR